MPELDASLKLSMSAAQPVEEDEALVPHRLYGKSQ